MKAYVDFSDIYIEIIGDSNKITSILFKREKEPNSYEKGSEVEKAKIQMEEYLQRKRKEFDLNLDLITTEFNTKVYTALKNIPYGTLKTYGEIAREVGSPKAFRAVGNANNKNKFVIVFACHRVIGSNNKLVGFAPGLRYKEELLKLEGIIK